MNLNRVQTGNSKTLQKAFISTFVNSEFFIDIIRSGLYPADFGVLASNSTVEYIKEFLTKLNSSVYSLSIDNFKAIQDQISVTNTILSIRESDSAVINYNNVTQHLQSQNLNVNKLIQSAVEQKLQSIVDFRQLIDNIINTIHAFYEVESISSTLIGIDSFQDSIYDRNLTPFELLKNYKDLIISAYNDLSKLQSINKLDKSDYFIISDKESCSILAKTMVDYISSGYSIFKTGYELFDNYGVGFESSSLHLISAPTNHGKSIFMVNICRTLIEQNIADFNKNDCVIFITLEDNIYKLSRRFCSIFGDYRYNVLKKLFQASYDISRNNQNNKAIKLKIENVFVNVFNNSIVKITQGKLNIIIKHAHENDFSPGDLGRFIDKLKVEGLNTKMVFVDYIDVK